MTDNASMAHQYYGQIFILDSPIIKGAGTLEIGDTTWRIRCKIDLPQGAKVRVIGSKSSTLLVEKPTTLDLPTRDTTSFLVEETKSMERKRRLVEQQGHRHWSSVKAREHSENPEPTGPEGELQNSIAQHPLLDNQRFDGIDPNLNPEPPLNTEARREFDNEQREQEMEKQLRLGNMPKFGTAPKPHGP